MSSLTDSGKREEFSTGSRRDVRTGKGRFDLLPARALKRLARHFELGAAKYGDRNWEKGQPISRLMDSGLRHAFAYLAGRRDEDHLIAAVWNLVCAAEIEERIREGALPESLNDLILTTGTDKNGDEKLFKCCVNCTSSGSCRKLGCWKEFSAESSAKGML